MRDKLFEDLERLGLSDLHEILVSHDVGPDLLGELSDDNLHEIGLSLGQRMRFRRAISRHVLTPKK